MSACHAGLAGARRRARWRTWPRSALGASGRRFKDKINYKQPGGAGFSPHQDLLAYPGAAAGRVDPRRRRRVHRRRRGACGSPTGVDELLDTTTGAWSSPTVVSSLTWSPAELAPGDAVCIGGLTPHYSEANRSSALRRVLVASYAPVAETGTTASATTRARRREMDEAAAR